MAWDEIKFKISADMDFGSAETQIASIKQGILGLRETMTDMPNVSRLLDNSLEKTVTVADSLAKKLQKLHDGDYKNDEEREALEKSITNDIAEVNTMRSLQSGQGDFSVSLARSWFGSLPKAVQHELDAVTPKVANIIRTRMSTLNGIKGNGFTGKSQAEIAKQALKDVEIKAIRDQLKEAGAKQQFDSLIRDLIPHVAPAHRLNAYQIRRYGSTISSDKIALDKGDIVDLFPESYRDAYRNKGFTPRQFSEQQGSQVLGRDAIKKLNQLIDTRPIMAKAAIAAGIASRDSRGVLQVNDEVSRRDWENFRGQMYDELVSRVVGYGYAYGKAKRDIYSVENKDKEKLANRLMSSTSGDTMAAMHEYEKFEQPEAWVSPTGSTHKTKHIQENRRATDEYVVTKYSPFLTRPNGEKVNPKQVMISESQNTRILSQTDPSRRWKNNDDISDTVSLVSLAGYNPNNKEHVDALYDLYKNGRIINGKKYIAQSTHGKGDDQVIRMIEESAFNRVNEQETEFARQLGLRGTYWGGFADEEIARKLALTKAGKPGGMTAEDWGKYLEMLNKAWTPSVDLGANLKGARVAVVDYHKKGDGAAYASNSVIPYSAQIRALLGGKGSVFTFGGKNFGEYGQRAGITDEQGRIMAEGLNGQLYDISGAQIILPKDVIKNLGAFINNNGEFLSNEEVNRIAGGLLTRYGVGMMANYSNEDIESDHLGTQMSSFINFIPAVRERQQKMALERLRELDTEAGQLKYVFGDKTDYLSSKVNPAFNGNAQLLETAAAKRRVDATKLAIVQRLIGGQFQDFGEESGIANMRLEATPLASYLMAYGKVDENGLVPQSVIERARYYLQKHDEAQMNLKDAQGNLVYPDYKPKVFTDKEISNMIVPDEDTVLDFRHPQQKILSIIRSPTGYGNMISKRNVAEDALPIYQGFAAESGENFDRQYPGIIVSEKHLDPLQSADYDADQGKVIFDPELRASVDKSLETQKFAKAKLKEEGIQYSPEELADPAKQQVLRANRAVVMNPGMGTGSAGIRIMQIDLAKDINKAYIAEAQRLAAYYDNRTVFDKKAIDMQLNDVGAWNTLALGKEFTKFSDNIQDLFSFEDDLKDEIANEPDLNQKNDVFRASNGRVVNLRKLRQMGVDNINLPSIFMANHMMGLSEINNLYRNGMVDTGNIDAVAEAMGHIGYGDAEGPGGEARRKLMDTMRGLLTQFGVGSRVMLTPAETRALEQIRADAISEMEETAIQYKDKESNTYTFEGKTYQNEYTLNKAREKRYGINTASNAINLFGVTEPRLRAMFGDSYQDTFQNVGPSAIELLPEDQQAIEIAEKEQALNDKIEEAKQKVAEETQKARANKRKSTKKKSTTKKETEASDDLAQAQQEYNVLKEELAQLQQDKIANQHTVDTLARHQDIISGVRDYNNLLWSYQKGKENKINDTKTAAEKYWGRSIGQAKEQLKPLAAFESEIASDESLNQEAVARMQKANEQERQNIAENMHRDFTNKAILEAKTVSESIQEALNKEQNAPSKQKQTIDNYNKNIEDAKSFSTFMSDQLQSGKVDDKYQDLYKSALEQSQNYIKSAEEAKGKLIDEYIKENNESADERMESLEMKLGYRDKKSISSKEKAIQKDIQEERNRLKKQLDEHHLSQNVYDEKINALDRYSDESLGRLINQEELNLGMRRKTKQEREEEWLKPRLDVLKNARKLQMTNAEKAWRTGTGSYADYVQAQKLAYGMVPDPKEQGLRNQAKAIFENQENMQTLLAQQKREDAQHQYDQRMRSIDRQYRSLFPHGNGAIARAVYQQRQIARNYQDQYEENIYQRNKAQKIQAEQVAGFENKYSVKYANYLKMTDEEKAKVGEGSDKDAQQIAQTAEQIKKYNQEAQAATAGSQKFSSAMPAIAAGLNKVTNVASGVIKRFGRQLFHKAISEAKRFVQEFDKSMTTIQMITLKTDSEMAKFGDKMIAKAQTLKVSISEVTKVAETLARQGLNDQQIDERLDTIIKFSTVSGANADASSKLVTIAINTGLVSSAQEATDIVAALGDNAATNAKEIEKGVEKAGAAAAADGTTFAQLASMLTAITSTTQIGGNVAGRTLNTIFGRMNKIGTNEIIYDENGNAISGSAIAQLLSAQGISTYDKEGNKRSSYDVLYELSQKWESFDDATQQQIANAIAGTRQYSNFSAIMMGMSEGKVDEYMQLAEGSEGIVDKKYAEYLKSLEATLNSVKTVWDEVVRDLVDKGALQEIANGFIGLIKIFGNIIGKLAELKLSLPVIMTVIGTIMGASSGGWVGAIIGAASGLGLGIAGQNAGEDYEEDQAIEQRRQEQAQRIQDEINKRNTTNATIEEKITYARTLQEQLARGELSKEGQQELDDTLSEIRTMLFSSATDAGEAADILSARFGSASKELDYYTEYLKRKQIADAKTNFEASREDVFAEATKVLQFRQQGHGSDLVWAAPTLTVSAMFADDWLRGEQTESAQNIQTEITSALEDRLASTNMFSNSEISTIEDNFVKQVKNKMYEGLSYYDAVNAAYEELIPVLFSGDKAISEAVQDYAIDTFLQDQYAMGYYKEEFKDLTTIDEKRAKAREILYPTKSSGENQDAEDQRLGIAAGVSIGQGAWRQEHELNTRAENIYYHTRGFKTVGEISDFLKENPEYLQDWKYLMQNNTELAMEVGKYLDADGNVINPDANAQVILDMVRASTTNRGSRYVSRAETGQIAQQVFTAVERGDARNGKIYASESAAREAAQQERNAEIEIGKEERHAKAIAAVTERAKAFTEAEEQTERNRAEKVKEEAFSAEDEARLEELEYTVDLVKRYKHVDNISEGLFVPDSEIGNGRYVSVNYGGDIYTLSLEEYGEYQRLAKEKEEADIIYSNTVSTIDQKAKERDIISEFGQISDAEYNEILTIAAKEEDERTQEEREKLDAYLMEHAELEIGDLRRTATEILPAVNEIIGAEEGKLLEEVESVDDRVKKKDYFSDTQRQAIQNILGEDLGQLYIDSVENETELDPLINKYIKTKIDNAAIGLSGLTSTDRLAGIKALREADFNLGDTHGVAADYLQGFAGAEEYLALRSKNQDELTREELDRYDVLEKQLENFERDLRISLEVEGIKSLEDAGELLEGTAATIEKIKKGGRFKIEATISVTTEIAKQDQLIRQLQNGSEKEKRDAILQLTGMDEATYDMAPELAQQYALDYAATKTSGFAAELALMRAEEKNKEAFDKKYSAFGMRWVEGEGEGYVLPYGYDFMEDENGNIGVYYLDDNDNLVYSAQETAAYKNNGGHYEYTASGVHYVNPLKYAEERLLDKEIAQMRLKIANGEVNYASIDNEHDRKVYEAAVQAMSVEEHNYAQGQIAYKERALQNATEAAQTAEINYIVEGIEPLEKAGKILEGTSKLLTEIQQKGTIDIKARVDFESSINDVQQQRAILQNGSIDEQIKTISSITGWSTTKVRDNFDKAYALANAIITQKEREVAGALDVLYQNEDTRAYAEELADEAGYELRQHIGDTTHTEYEYDEKTGEARKIQVNDVNYQYHRNTGKNPEIDRERLLTEHEYNDTELIRIRGDLFNLANNRDAFLSYIDTNYEDYNAGINSLGEKGKKYFSMLEEQANGSKKYSEKQLEEARRAAIDENNLTEHDLELQNRRTALSNARYNSSTDALAYSEFEYEEANKTKNLIQNLLNLQGNYSVADLLSMDLKSAEDEERRVEFLGTQDYQTYLHKYAGATEEEKRRGLAELAGLSTGRLTKHDYATSARYGLSLNNEYRTADSVYAERIRSIYGDEVYQDWLAGKQIDLTSSGIAAKENAYIYGQSLTSREKVAQIARVRAMSPEELAQIENDEELDLINEAMSGFANWNEYRRLVSAEGEEFEKLGGQARLDELNKQLEQYQKNSEIEIDVDGIKTLEETQEVLEGTTSLVEQLKKGGKIELEARIKFSSDLYEQSQLDSMLRSGNQELVDKAAQQITGVTGQRYYNNREYWIAQATKNSRLEREQTSTSLEQDYNSATDKAAFLNGLKGTGWSAVVKNGKMTFEYNPENYVYENPYAGINNQRRSESELARLRKQIFNGDLTPEMVGYADAMESGGEAWKRYQWMLANPDLVSPDDLFNAQLEWEQEEAAAESTRISGFSSTFNQARSAQYAIDNYTGLNAGTIASYLSMDEETIKEMMKTDEGKQVLQDKINEQAVSLYTAMARDLGIEIDATDTESLKSQLQKAADNAEGQLKFVLQSMVDALTDAGEIIGTSGFDTFEQTVTKQLESKAQNRKAMSAVSNAIQTGDYASLLGNSDVNWETVDSGLLYMLYNRANGSTAFSDEMISGAYQNALLGRKSSPETQQQILSNLFGGNLSAENMISTYQMWMQDQEKYAGEIAAYQSLEGLDDVTEAMTSEYNATDKTSKALEEYNKQVGINQINYLNKYGKATANVADYVTKLGQGAKSAVPAIGSLVSNMNKLGYQNKQLQAMTGKAGSQLSSEQLDIVSEITGIDKNVLKTYGADMMTSVVEGAKDVIDQQWAEEIASPMVGQINEALKGENAIQLARDIEISTDVNGQIDIKQLASLVKAYDDNLYSVLAAYDGTGATLFANLEANENGVGYILDLIRAGAGTSGTKPGGGGGGGKSKVDKLLEAQKRKVTAAEHDVKMLEIAEKEYDYRNDYGGWSKNIDEQIAAQLKLKDVYAANIAEMKEMLANTKEGSDDWYKLKEAIYSAEEAFASINSTISELNAKNISILEQKQQNQDKPNAHLQSMLEKLGQRAMSEDRFNDYLMFAQQRITEINAQKTLNEVQLAEWESQLSNYEEGSDAWIEVRDKIWAIEEENAELENQAIQQMIELNEQRLAQIAKVLQYDTGAAVHNQTIASAYGNAYQTGGYRSVYESMVVAQIGANNVILEENRKAEAAARAQMNSLEEGTTAWYAARAAVYQYQEAIAQTTVSQIELNRSLAESNIASVEEAYTDATREIVHVNSLLENQAQEYLTVNDYEAYSEAMTMYIRNITDQLEAEEDALASLQAQYNKGMEDGTLDPAMQREYLDKINERESSIQQLRLSEINKQRELDKNNLDYTLELQDRAANDYSHNIQLVQYQATKYQNAGELTNYGKAIEADTKLRQERIDTLQDEIAELKEEREYFNERYGEGTDEEIRIVEQIKKREEALESENVQIEKNNKLLEENQKKIRQVQKTLEDAVDKEIEAQKKREREMLASNVSMQNTILDLLKKRLQDEWDLKKKDIEKEKESLNEYKKLINERFNYRKKAAQQADKDEELAEYRRQLALIEADPSRTKDAKELRRKIEDLEKEKAWTIAEDELANETDRIDENIQSMDNYISYNEEKLNELLSDANNFATELGTILSGSFEESYDKIIEFMQKENEAFMKSLPDAQQQMIQGWEDTWKKANDIVDSNYAMITTILRDKDTYMEYMKNTNRDYRSYLENGDENSMRILETTWSDYYDDYIASIKNDAEIETHEHPIGDVISKIDELKENVFQVNIIGISGTPPTAYGFDEDGFRWYDRSNGEGYSLNDYAGIGKVNEPVAETPAKTSSKSSGKKSEENSRYMVVFMGGEGSNPTAQHSYTVYAANEEAARREAEKLLDYNNASFIYAKKYKYGGLVDYTGPAWVDGTKTRPESFLDSVDTSLLREMLDTYSYIRTTPYMSNVDTSQYVNNTSVGDVNITINQAELKSDADIASLAKRVGQAFTKELKVNGISMTGYNFA